ncbi:hypothetical protein I79_013429 [Cricetulus griseus]|uniref:Uncharacterized protein n=1 Tax=Cricetulus griseus TaxID=10029 RepID=G3HRG3_CRIGR|nr:hypothetical protein I79_013429 [Cricetulus griseus]
MIITVSSDLFVENLIKQTRIRTSQCYSSKYALLHFTLFCLPASEQFHSNT